MELEISVALALGFALTSGFHDAADAIATLVATRAATPAQAIVLASVGNVAGALLFGTAVAAAIASIVDVSGVDAISIIGSAVLAALVWNVVTWWKGLPASSGHALVGGLVGAAVSAAGVGAVHWGGFENGRPAGLLGVLAALALAPVAGFVAGGACERALRAAATRATRRASGSVRGAQWVLSGAVAVGHGGNDAQKMMGIVAVLLLAGGETSQLSVPFWVKLSCGLALTVGTALGGWRIVRTVGRGIFRLRPLDALASEAASSGVLIGASLVGAPVSTTHVVTSAVVGVGGGRGRWRHIRWHAVQSIGVGWLLTIPVTAALSAATVQAWRAVT